MALSGGTGQDYLEGARVGCAREHVISLVELIQREVVGDKSSRVDVVAGEQAQECRRRVRVDQAGRDGDVPGPLVFEVQGRGRAVHADVGDVPARPNQGNGELEGGGHADRFDRHVGAQAASQGLDHLKRVLLGVVNRDIRAELLGCLQPGVSQVDRDDVTRAVQASAHDRGKADRTRSDDCDHVPRPYLAVEDAYLITGRQDVGQHEDVLVGRSLWYWVGRGVGERHPDVLGLGAVDHVTEDPAPPAGHLPRTALAAEPDTPADRHARYENAIADLDGLHAAAD